MLFATAKRAKRLDRSPSQTAAESKKRPAAFKKATFITFPKNTEKSPHLPPPAFFLRQFSEKELPCYGACGVW